VAISLESISKGQRLRPPKILFYGETGIGKTTFAASTPDPIFLFTEPGMGSLDVERFEVRKGDEVLRSWEEVIECVWLLQNETHKYKTIVIDTVDSLEPLLHKYTCEKHNQPNIHSFGWTKGFDRAVDEARDLTTRLDALCNQKGMVVLILGHCTVEKFRNPQTESFDRWCPKVDKKLSDHLKGWADGVLFANFIQHTVSSDEGFNKKRTRGVGLGERIIYTEARPSYQAKNRWALPPEMPLNPENGWAVIQQAIAEQHAQKSKKTATKAKGD
jgi:hypothetical protein